MLLSSHEIEFVWEGFWGCYRKSDINYIRFGVASQPEEPLSLITWEKYQIRCRLDLGTDFYQMILISPLPVKS